MLAILRKEINAFFSSLVAYMALGLFLLLTGLFLWVFPDFSILDYGYASLEQLFAIGPWVFMFLVPAVTMRAFAEEIESGTIELLFTRPLRDADIIGGKFLAAWLLLLLALLPTSVYYFSVHQLGSPPGNLDTGAILGSYLGLWLLGGAFAAIGLWASALTRNQIVAFLLAAFFCFLAYEGFDYLSQLPAFFGSSDYWLQALGISGHYRSLSRGLLVLSDVLYFFAFIAVFLYATWLRLRGLRA